MLVAQLLVTVCLPSQAIFEADSEEDGRAAARTLNRVICAEDPDYCAQVSDRKPIYEGYRRPKLKWIQHARSAGHTEHLLNNNILQHFTVRNRGGYLGPRNWHPTGCQDSIARISALFSTAKACSFPYLSSDNPGCTGHELGADGECHPVACLPGWEYYDMDITYPTYSGDAVRSVPDCRRCGNGAFKVGSNKATCQDKRTSCGPGHEFQAGSDSEKTKDDTTCNACGSGQFKSGTNANQCEPKRTSCPAGHQLIPSSDKTQDDTGSGCGVLLSGQKKS